MVGSQQNAVAMARRAGRRVMSRVKGAREFMRDMRRYYRYSAPAGTESFSKLSGRNLECQVTKDYHRIEKGLSLSSPRQPFGIKVQERLEVLMGTAGAAGNYIQYAGDAITALESWNSDGVIDPLVCPDGSSLMRASIDSAELEKFFASRRSVRSFDPSLPVPEELIRSAVSMALNTPSVCNRQPWRVHVFESGEAQDVLRHHNGSAAFASTIPAVAVVTSDSRLFSGSGERNQRWIDGGLFAMSLVWALHGQGLATCMLNWSRVNSASDALRETAAIGDSEEIIVMIAIGYPTDNFRIARSSRRDVDSVLVSSADRAVH